MRTIEARLSDGRMIEVQVPVDWSDGQISAEINRIDRSQAKPQPTVSTMEQRLAEMNPIERGLVGVGRGMVNVGRQVGNILGMVSDEELAEYEELERPLMETTAGQVGSFIGEVAALAPAGGGLVGLGGRAATAAVPALRATAAARPVATAMATGAAEGALEGAVIGGPGQRAEGATAGAIAGGLTGGIAPLISRGLIRPTPEAQRLLEMGVDLTPGQMQPRSFLNKLEQSVQSMVKGGWTEDAQREFAQKIIQEGAPPNVRLEPGNLNEMLAQSYKAYAPAYDKLKNMPVNPQITQQLKTGFRQAIDDPDILAGDEQRRIAQRFLDNQLSRLTGKKPKAGDILSVRSKIRSKISDAKKAQKWDEAEILGNAEAYLTEQLNRGMPQGAADYNRVVDSFYSKYKVAEDALYRMGDREFPTPYQWSQSIKKGVPKGQYARGAGRLRPEVEAASRVFQTVSPPTGARLATLAAGGGLGLGAYATMDPALLTAMGVGALPLIGTRAGRQFSAGMAPWQAGLADLLRQTPLSTGILPRGAAAIGAAEQEKNQAF